MKQVNWYGTVLAIRRMVVDVKMVQTHRNGENTANRELRQIGWIYRTEDWVKLNMDGCSIGKGVAGAGGAIRDGMGTWLMGFARNNGVCSSVTAELWAVYIGLELAWTKSLKRLYWSQILLL